MEEPNVQQQWYVPHPTASYPGWSHLFPYTSGLLFPTRTCTPPSMRRKSICATDVLLAFERNEWNSSIEHVLEITSRCTTPFIE